MECFDVDHRMFDLPSTWQLDHKRRDEKTEKDRLNSIYLELVEKQRSYYKTVRDFQEVSYQHT